MLSVNTIGKFLAMTVVGVGFLMTQVASADPTTPGNQRPGAVIGTVVDGDGLPVKGADVEVMRDGARDVVAKMVTGIDGRFKFDGLAPGVYLIKSVRRDFGEGVVRVQIVSRRVVKATIVLR